MRRSDLQRKYGITVEDYELMLERQDGGCAICGAGPGKRRLHVDHDHESEVVRALLCGDCNTGIGKFDENPELLRRAAAYLENHGQA